MHAAMIADDAKGVLEVPDVLFNPLFALVGKCSDVGTEHWCLTRRWYH